MVGGIGKSGAVGLGIGKNVVLIGLVPRAVNRFIFLSEHGGPAQIITGSCELQSVEHLNEFGFSPIELKLVRNAEIADYLHANNLKVVGPNRWFAAGDKHNFTGEFRCLVLSTFNA
jgi:hypothetical protein